MTGVTGTIADLAGNALSTAGLPETFTGVVVDTTTPTISVDCGIAVERRPRCRQDRHLTLTITEAVTVNTTAARRR